MSRSRSDEGDGHLSHGSGAAEDAPNKTYFLIRRLHSLCGIVPVGVFLLFHILVNASVLDTPAAFQDRVDMIHSMGKFLVPVEIFGIFIPILFHALLGIKIILSGRPNPMSYTYGASWRYALQRWTGMIAFVFIMVHLWHMHWIGSPFGGGFFDPNDATRTAASAMQRSVFWAPFYAFGLLASVYHFSNGIWTSLITWGITIGANAQKKAGYACAVFGIVLSVMGLATVIKLRTTDPDTLAVPSHVQQDDSEAVAATATASPAFKTDGSETQE